jgi:plasmid maintenance system killer protein
LEITFATKKLEKLMNSDEQLRISYGAKKAEQLRRRLDDLDAAVCLEDMRELPGRCEELTSDRKGELSMRVSANDRLIFRPDHDPLPRKPDGGLDWNRVTRIVILEVVDYH